MLEKENTSTIPPLTEKSPGSTTKSSLLNSKSNSFSLKDSNEIKSPVLIFKNLFLISFLIIIFSKIASGYVTINFFKVFELRFLINSVLKKIL